MARVFKNHTQYLREDRPVEVDDEYQDSNIAARIIYLIGGLIISLLSLRFLLALLGANPANSFANFIYTVSGFFAAPFFGLFSYHTSSGIVRFEYETLIAIIFYSILTWLIIHLLSIGDE
jgi:hypothetical protein